MDGGNRNTASCFVAACAEAVDSCSGGTMPVGVAVLADVGFTVAVSVFAIESVAACAFSMGVCGVFISSLGGSGRDGRSAVLASLGALASTGASGLDTGGLGLARAFGLADCGTTGAGSAAFGGTVAGAGAMATSGTTSRATSGAGLLSDKAMRATVGDNNKPCIKHTKATRPSSVLSGIALGKRGVSVASVVTIRLKCI